MVLVWNVTPPKQSKDICIRGPIGLVITNSATRKALDKCELIPNNRIHTINVGSLLRHREQGGSGKGIPKAAKYSN